MAYTYAFGGDPNNTNGYTDYSNNYFYSDYGSGWPSGNASSDGGAPVKLYSSGVDWSSGATWTDIVHLGGSSFRVRVGHGGGRLQVGRNTGNGSSMIDSADGQALTGGICGWFTWATVALAPSMLDATKLADGRMRVRFSGNGNTGGASMDGWQLQYAKNAAFTSGVVTVSSSGTSDLSLTPGTQYWFRSRGHNDVGWSAWSGSISATTATAASAPTLSSVTQQSPQSFKATWTTPSSNGGADITGYRFEYATNPQFTGATVVTLGVVNTRTVTGLNPGFQYYVRVTAINGTNAMGAAYNWSATKNVVLITEIGDLDGWAVFGSLPVNTAPLIGTGVRRGGILPLPGKTGLIREIQATGSGTVVGGSIGLQKTITTKPGTNYKLNARAVVVSDVTPAANGYALGVSGIGTGSTAILTQGTPGTLPEYSFTATGTSHVVQIIMSESTGYAAGWFEAAAFYEITLTEIPVTSPFRLQDTVYEGPLSQHFTYACDSVGASWWVDRFGVTKFRQAESQDAIVSTFSDRRGTGVLEYTAIEANYDVEAAINILNVNNHGRNPSTGDAQDVTYRGQDSASIAAWGPYSGSMDTTLRTDFVDRENLVTNPESGTATTNYSLVQATGAGTLSRITGQSGTVASTAARYTVSTAAGTWFGIRFTSVPVTAGVSYAFSAYGKPNVAKTTQAVIGWYNAGGTLISETQGISSAHSAATWGRREAIGTAPAGAVTARLDFRVTNAGAVGNLLDATGLLFEATGTVSDYFTGNTPANTSAYWGYAWTGTAHASTSVRLVQDLNRRFDAILAKYGTPALFISAIQWNAQQDPLTAARLDIQDRIRVEFTAPDGTQIVQDSRIVGIRHALSGERWMMTLELAQS